MDTQPLFRPAFHSQRCLVVVDGFYEWQRVGRGKVPHFIHLRSERPFALAGLWQNRTCAVITCAPNALLAPIHNRMPVIVPRRAYDVWLDPARGNAAELRALLTPYAPDEMNARPVSPLVNSPSNDGVECTIPLAREGRTLVLRLQ